MIFSRIFDRMERSAKGSVTDRFSGILARFGYVNYDSFFPENFCL